MEVEAQAKLNLTFEVLGKRDDGYHEVKTVMQTIGLSDRISLEHWPTLRVDCDSRELSGEANLVYKAAQSLARSRGTQARGANSHSEENSGGHGTGRRQQRRRGRSEGLE